MKSLAMALALALLCASTPANAQRRNKERDKTNTRSVVGVVLDSRDNPLDGAVVQLKDTKSLEIRSFITRADGRFHFSTVSADVDYELKAEHQGKSSNTRLLSVFDSRKQASMNLTIDK